MNVKRARHEDADTVAELLDEATVWVGELGFEQWPLPFPRDELAEAIDRGDVYVVEGEDGEPVATLALLHDDPLRLDCLGENPRIRDYYEELGFEHRRDLVLNGRSMSLYERPVR